MAFFKVLEKIIAESGVSYILKKCGYPLISRLNYNKCKRMHEILAAAFEVLHFEKFLDKQEDVEEIIDIIKLEIKDIETDSSVFSKEADEILDRYETFCQETENETHGNTGAFWMKHINLMNIYHNFTRSVRTGDFDLYIACLSEISHFVI